MAVRHSSLRECGNMAGTSGVAGFVGNHLELGGALNDLKTGNESFLVHHGK